VPPLRRKIFVVDVVVAAVVVVPKNKLFMAFLICD